MKTRKLGNTALQISEIGFGGSAIANLYQECSPEAAFATFTACWDLGIRYFDTAPEYGHGLSERRMGDFLRTKPRDEFIISTKVGEILYARHDVFPPETKFINKLPFHLRFDYSYDGIMRAFEDSLQRLGLNRIDMLFVHDLDPIIQGEKQFPELFKQYVEGGYKALNELRSQGVIQAIGLGVKKWEVCFDAMQYGDYDCHMLQGNYTLLEQQAAISFLDVCLSQKISVLIAGPFASGILATGAIPGAYFNHKPANEEILEKVRRMTMFCESQAVPLQAAAIQFPLMHPAITSVVMASSKPEWMVENIKHANHSIPSNFWLNLKEKGLIHVD